MFSIESALKTRLATPLDAEKALLKPVITGERTMEMRSGSSSLSSSGDAKLLCLQGLATVIQDGSCYNSGCKTSVGARAYYSNCGCKTLWRSLPAVATSLSAFQRSMESSSIYPDSYRYLCA